MVYMILPFKNVFSSKNECDSTNYINFRNLKTTPNYKSLLKNNQEIRLKINPETRYSEDKAIVEI